MGDLKEARTMKGQEEVTACLLVRFSSSKFKLVSFTVVSPNLPGAWCLVIFVQ